MAQRRLSEAEVEMDRKSWERGKSCTAIYQTNRQLESQQMELFYANLWASQAENRRRFEELAMKSSLYQESHAKDCFEISELRLICREEAEESSTNEDR